MHGLFSVIAAMPENRQGR